MNHILADYLIVLIILLIGILILFKCCLTSPMMINFLINRHFSLRSNSPDLHNRSILEYPDRVLVNADTEFSISETQGVFVEENLSVSSRLALGFSNRLGMGSLNQIINSREYQTYLTDFTLIGLAKNIPIRYKINNKLRWPVFNVKIIETDKLSILQTDKDIDIEPNDALDIKLLDSDQLITHEGGSKPDNTSSWNYNEIENFSCVICFLGCSRNEPDVSDIKNRHIICKTWCGHLYHKECLGKWLLKCSNKNLICPMCRNGLILDLQNKVSK